MEKETRISRILKAALPYQDKFADRVPLEKGAPVRGVSVRW